MIGLIAYGAGNLRSVGNALDAIQKPWCTLNQPDDADGCTHLILPGVGHFGPLMQGLQTAGWPEVLNEWQDQDRPLLGICLGMQALYEGSDEAPELPGLGWIPGRAMLYPPTVKVPHMGWDEVRPQPGCRLIPAPESYYFANSYFCPGESASAITEYGLNFAAAVERGNLAGVQFHPEKSGQAGLDLLRRFATW